MMIHPSVQKLSKRLWLFLPIPGVVAAVTYLVTLSRGVCPGYSAMLTAAAAGLIPPSAAEHPIFALAARTVASLEIFGLPLRVNLFSALCGTLCAMLLYYLSARQILFSACEDQGGAGVREEEGDAYETFGLPPEVAHYNNRYVLKIAIAGGLLAAFMFIFSGSIWCAATRLDNGLFDLLLAMVAIALFPVGTRASWILRLALSVLLFTLGLFDSAAFFLFLPVYVFFAIKVVIFNERRSAAVACIMVAIAAGTAFAIFAYGQNMEASSTLLALLTQSAHELPSRHYHELISFFPRTGWALVVLQSGVPAVLLLFGLPNMFKEKSLGSTLMTVLVVMFVVAPVLLNLPIASFFGLQSTVYLPVICPALQAPALAAALAAGILLFIHNDKTKEDESDNDIMFVIKPYLALWVERICVSGLLAVLLLCALVTPWFGFRAADTRCSLFADEIARVMLDAMNGRTWLISNGYLDNHLLVQAAQRKQPLTLIKLQSTKMEVARLSRLIASSPVFEGQNRQRLQNALSLGIARFVMEWLTADHDAGSRVMIFASPDIWTSCGYRAVPEGLAFGGLRPEVKLELNRIEEANRMFAERVLPLLTESDKVSGYMASLREMLRMKAGFASNELGVMLEDTLRHEAAYQAYMRASQIDPMNISAAVNGYALASVQKIHSEALDRLAQRVSAATDGRNLSVQGILNNYGTIRQPEFYQQQSMLWSASGMRTVATDKIRRAQALTSKTGAAALVDDAFFYVQNGSAFKAENCYLAALEKEPANRAALSGLCLLMISQKNALEAEKWIRMSREAGVEQDALLYPEITLAILKKEFDQALSLLAEATKKFPTDLRYWTMQADILLEQNDIGLVEHKVLPEMVKALKDPNHFMVHAVRGFMLRKKGADHFLEARLSLLRALSLNAAMPDIWNAVFELDMALGVPEFTETDAHNLLMVDPEHALANYLMGVALLAHGKLSEAEDFLRRSIEKCPTAAACNDLAEDLRLQKRLDDAEAFARQALGIDPELLPALDTLSCILTDKGDYSEAVRLADRAVAANPDYAPAQLTLLRANVRQGDKGGVRQQLSALTELQIAIPEDLQKEIEDLK